MSGAILALDAAAAACSVALWRDGGVLVYRESPMVRGHAEALMPLVLEAMAAVGLDFADLEKIAVGVGPGSFTGIRIALAAARGIALAADRPVMGIDSFNALAAAIPVPLLAGHSLLVVIESKRRELFGQYFDSHRQARGEALVLEPSALLKMRPAGPLLVAGDGAVHLPAGPKWQARSAVDARAIARRPKVGLFLARFRLTAARRDFPGERAPGPAGRTTGANCHSALGAELPGLAGPPRGLLPEPWDAGGLRPARHARAPQKPAARGPSGDEGPPLPSWPSHCHEAEIISLLGTRGTPARIARRLLTAESGGRVARAQRLFSKWRSGPRALLCQGPASPSRQGELLSPTGRRNAALVLARNITVGRNPGSQIGEKS